MPLYSLTGFYAWFVEGAYRVLRKVYSVEGFPLISVHPAQRTLHPELTKPQPLIPKPDVQCNSEPLLDP